MATIEIITETEGKNQWTYTVCVKDDGETHQFDVTLNWSDYDLWCRGRVAPECVVKAAFEFLLQQEPVGDIQAKFDCSLIRRYFPQIDAELPAMV